MADAPKIVFLLGSGISIPAGIPGVCEITKRVLSGEGIMSLSSEVYEFGEPDYQNDPLAYVWRVVSFLDRLKVEIDDYNSPSRRPWLDHTLPTNYEDLFSMASQIHDSEIGHDNPAIQPLIDKILPDIQPVLKRDQNPELPRSDLKIGELAGAAEYYIIHVVRLLLDRDPTMLDHLKPIGDACREYPSSIDIFTLNHDTLLERYFRDDIEYIDGFEENDEGWRCWDSSLFEERTDMVRLYKLHGSIDWRRSARDVESKSPPMCFPVDPDLQRKLDLRNPIILAGTFNKEREYFYGIFTELHIRFYQALQNAEYLVICGYGCSDAGINARIAGWMNGADDRRVVVIDKKTETEYPNGVILRNWSNWKKKGQLEYFGDGIKADMWQGIKEGLGINTPKS